MKYDNRIKTTLPPLYARLVREAAEQKGMTQSKIIAEAVKARFQDKAK